MIATAKSAKILSIASALPTIRKAALGDKLDHAFDRVFGTALEFKFRGRNLLRTSERLQPAGAVAAASSLPSSKWKRNLPKKRHPGRFPTRRPAPSRHPRGNRTPAAKTETSQQ